MIRRIVIAAAALSLFACGPAPQNRQTATIAPATPRPSPTTSTIGAHPVVTTTGSPAPHDAVAAMEQVRIVEGGVEMRHLIPRTNTAFHLRNETSAAHSVQFKSSRQTITSPAIAPGADMFLQIDLRDAEYLVSVSGQKHTAVTVTTYVPGQALGAR